MLNPENEPSTLDIVQELLKSQTVNDRTAAVDLLFRECQSNPIPELFAFGNTLDDICGELAQAERNNEPIEKFELKISALIEDIEKFKKTL